MPVFPKKEADIAALAEPLRRGLLANRPVYPKPPIHPIALRIKSLAYKNRREVLLAKKAHAKTATTAKDDALEDLIKALKSQYFWMKTAKPKQTMPKKSRNLGTYLILIEKYGWMVGK